MLVGKYELIIKKSKFIAYLYDINSSLDADLILDDLKSEHKKARHIPYAYKLPTTAKKSDDKEPSGTAGMPILNILERNNMDHYMIAVVRYFGGTKLGAGPLLRAYSNSANEVVKEYLNK